MHASVYVVDAHAIHEKCAYASYVCVCGCICWCMHVHVIAHILIWKVLCLWLSWAALWLLVAIQAQNYPTACGKPPTVPRLIARSNDLFLEWLGSFTGLWGIVLVPSKWFWGRFRNNFSALGKWVGDPGLASGAWRRHGEINCRKSCSWGLHREQKQ